MTQSKPLAYLSIILFVFQPIIEKVQNNSINENEKQMIHYFNISVDFYSIGQGTNNDAEDELFNYINKVQKQFKITIDYEKHRWGREGEQFVYMDVSSLPILEEQIFLNNLIKMFVDKNKMAIVRANLYYEPQYNYLTLGIMLYGQNKERENVVLNYINGYEKANNVKINYGTMINETSIPEDQDKRYQFNLNELTETQRIEIINKVKELMKVSISEK